MNSHSARGNHRRRKPDAGGVPWRPLVLIAAVVAFGVLAFRWLDSPKTVESANDQSGGAASAEFDRDPGTAALGVSEASSADAPDEKRSARESSVQAAAAGSGYIAPQTPARETLPLARVAPPEPVYDFAYAQELVAGLAQIDPGDGKLLPSEIESIKQTLEELVRQGPAGVAAIEEFLATGADLELPPASEAKDLVHSTLRLALIDTLGQIGGPEALDAMVGMLPAAMEPAEIAMLAEGLEDNAPGEYRTEITDATRSTLALALESDPAEFRGLGHLFGVIQGYGDETMAADLEDVYRTAKSAWSNYALMALSRLPEGQGAPYVVGIVNELSADPERNAATYGMALRMLAQVSREDPKAADDLVRLAQQGQLDTSAVAAVAATLGGREYQIIAAGSEVAKNSRAATFLNGRAPETWTDAEIDQRLDMIDQLLRTDPEPAAVEALAKAEERLLVWKERPMVNGKRVTLR